MIALVTGASRGVGKAIALALGDAGAAELAEEYGFNDEDGARPRSLRHEYEEVH